CLPVIFEPRRPIEDGEFYYSGKVFRSLILARLLLLIAFRFLRLILLLLPISLRSFLPLNLRLDPFPELRLLFHLLELIPLLFSPPCRSSLGTAIRAIPVNHRDAPTIPIQCACRRERHQAASLSSPVLALSPEAIVARTARMPSFAV